MNVPNIIYGICVSFKSIIVQSDYCLNFLPEKEHDELK